MSQPFIIAIDFGTSFSGYAFSLTPTTSEIVPLVKMWKKRLGLKTPKTPTCILLNENGEFLHFGYKAQKKYFKMHKDITKYYFFKNFKMHLYGKKITTDLEISDVNRRKMSALKVFSAALRFLKEDALETINQSTSRVKYISSDFTWVLTVPAIWDISARQFMRKAAVQAQIPSSEDKLVIALEPEAASVWCKQLPSKGFIKDRDEKVKLSAGTRYIVVDCGGGTIDITVHEVLEGGALKELHKASGNDKGGQRVDRKLIQSMREFFCDGLWEDHVRDHPKEAQMFVEDLLYFRQAQQKHVYKLQMDNEFKQTVQRKEDCQAEGCSLFKEVEGISWDNGKLVISEQKMESFFHETLVHITDGLSEILKKHADIKYIMLVGGLSSCRILSDRVRGEFGDQAQVLCPKNPQEAILKGAVMFGRDQSVIRTRKSAFTYGYVKMNRFDPTKHKPEKKYTNKEGDWCNDLFGKMVEIDEDVGWNETRNFSFRPTDSDQTLMTLEFYRTERKNVTYVDEWGVEGPVGSCDVPMPDVSKGLNRTVKLEVFFGFTEIKAKATDLESNCTAFVKIDFTSKSY